jgi:hypothetical protein
MPLERLQAKQHIRVARACFDAQEIFQEEMPMQRAFSIPHVPVVLSEISLVPKRVDVRAMLRTAGNRCLFVLRRFVDVMASGGAMS